MTIVSLGEALLGEKIIESSLLGSKDSVSFLNFLE